VAKVSIDINGERYALGCDDGEEERLIALGKKLDARVMQLADQFGQIGNLRLLVMASITLTDELDEIQDMIESKSDSLTAEIRKKSEAAQARAERNEVKAADSLLDAAMRIEKLAERLAENQDG